MKKPNIAGYFEIPVSNIERAVEFYSFVFECEFHRENIHGNEMAMFPFDPDSDGVSGALALGEVYKPSKEGSVVYLNTSSIDTTMGRVLEKSGSQLFPKSAAGEYGFVAEFEDCEGNRIALFEASPA